MYLLLADQFTVVSAALASTYIVLIKLTKTVLWCIIVVRLSTCVVRRTLTGRCGDVDSVVPYVVREA
jgi:hypothetical protein